MKKRGVPPLSINYAKWEAFQASLECCSFVGNADRLQGTHLQVHIPNEQPGADGACVSRPNVVASSDPFQ